METKEAHEVEINTLLDELREIEEFNKQQEEYRRQLSRDKCNLFRSKNDMELLKDIFKSLEQEIINAEKTVKESEALILPFKETKEMWAKIDEARQK